MQPDVLTRIADNRDVTAIQALWRNVFGDTDATIDAFLGTYSVSNCVVITDNGTVASMTFMLPVGQLVSGGTTAPCVMVYAVATDERYRNRGYGARIVNAAVEIAHERGCVAVLRPADEGLRRFYNERTQFRDGFTSAEHEFRITDGAKTGLREAATDEYRTVREKLLADTPHINFDTRALTLFTQLGGTLLTGDNIAAAVEPRDGGLFAVELLCGEERRNVAAQSIAAHFDADFLTVRYPDAYGEPFGMVTNMDVSGAWYGFAFE